MASFGAPLILYERFVQKIAPIDQEKHCPNGSPFHRRSLHP
jgi:hypothetical protein